MPEILLNKELFEQMNGRFETVFNNALEGSRYANKAERAQNRYQTFTGDLATCLLNQESDNFRQVMDNIVASFTETDKDLREKASKIRDVYVGPDNVINVDIGNTPISQEVIDRIINRGGGISSAGGGHGGFGGGGGGGGIRGSDSKGSIVTEIWDSIKELPKDVKQGWQACRDVASWYNSLPEETREVIGKTASIISDKIDKGGSLYTSIQMVHDVFSANSGLEAAEKVIDSVGKVAGTTMKSAAGASGAFGAAITIDCAMLTDYTKGLFKSTVGAIKGETNAGKVIYATGTFASKTVDAIKAGDWGKAGLNSLKTVGCAAGGPLLAVFDGAAEGAGIIYDGLADTAKGIFNIFGGGGSFGKTIVDSLHDEADSLKNFV